MRKILLYVGGSITLCFSLFHLAFWKLFNWQEELIKLDPENKGIMQMLNIVSVYTLLFGAFVSFYLAKRKGAFSFIEKALIIFIAGYYIVRMPDAIIIQYYLKEATEENVTIRVLDAEDKVIRELGGKKSAGLNRVLWNMRPTPPERQPGQRRFFGRGSMVDPGEYTVVLKIGDEEFRQKAVITKRTGWAVGPSPTKIK